MWERGRGLHPVDRALVLLAAAQPGMSWEQLARLQIGRRDILLLALRELTFGSRLASYAECPHCGEKLEFDHPVSDILASLLMPGAEEPTGKVESGLVADSVKALEMDGFTVRFRLPDSFDLAAVAGCREPEEARRLLLERCVLEVVRKGGEAQETSGSNPDSIALRDLPGEVVSGLSAQIGRADPGADIALDLTCPDCDHRWSITFDIVQFFWAEINNLAKRLLREVHTLARAYGWSEADILAMSAARRLAYLEMVL